MWIDSFWKVKQLFEDKFPFATIDAEMTKGGPWRDADGVLHRHSSLNLFITVRWQFIGALHVSCPGQRTIGVHIDILDSRQRIKTAILAMLKNASTIMMKEKLDFDMDALEANFHRSVPLCSKIIHEIRKDEKLIRDIEYGDLFRCRRQPVEIPTFTLSEQEMTLTLGEFC